MAVSLHLELRPTHLEALRELHQKLLRDHGGATHEPHEKAVARRAELQQGGTEDDSDKAGGVCAFDRMRAAASAQSVARQRAAVDARLLEQAQTAELEAVRAREAAEARAKASASAATLAAGRRVQSWDQGSYAGLQVNAHPPG